MNADLFHQYVTQIENAQRRLSEVAQSLEASREWIMRLTHQIEMLTVALRASQP